jgi:hypothetical protein
VSQLGRRKNFSAPTSEMGPILALKFFLLGRLPE